MSIGKVKRTVYGEVIVQTPEISEYLYFEFFGIVWCWYRPDKPNATDDPRMLARWISNYHKVVSDMRYCIITDTNKIVSNKSVKHVMIYYYLKLGI